VIEEAEKINNQKNYVGYKTESLAVTHVTLVNLKKCCLVPGRLVYTDHRSYVSEVGAKKINKIPCGTKCLWEFIFADWRFFVFCETQFLRLGQKGFSCLAIFRKYRLDPVPSTENIFVFIE